MRNENPIQLARALKGAPLSIVFVLQLVHQRVSQEWLERATGYTDKPVSQALAYLEEMGHIDHTSSGWQLTGQMQQLPLPLELLPEESGEPETETEKSDTDGMSRNNSDSLNNIIIITDSLNKEEDSNNNNTPPSRNFSDSDNSAPDISGTIDELKRAGVVGPRLERLARLPHVTPGYVRAWDQQLRREKGDEYKPGLLIYVIESGAAAPAVNENGHILKCKCEECIQMTARIENKKQLEILRFRHPEEFDENGNWIALEIQHPEWFDKKGEEDDAEEETD